MYLVRLSAPILTDWSVCLAADRLLSPSAALQRGVGTALDVVDVMARMALGHHENIKQISSTTLEQPWPSREHRAGPTRSYRQGL